MKALALLSALLLSTCVGPAMAPAFGTQRITWDMAALVPIAPTETPNAD